MGVRRRLRHGVLIAVVAALALTLAACGESGTGARGQPAPTIPPAKVALEPGAGATGVSPNTPAKVTVSDGTIRDLTLTNDDGKAIEGTLADDKRSWVAGTKLGYGRTYTWAGSAVGADGKEVPISGSFTMVQPSRTITASVNVADNQEYGVAMPITVQFSAPVQDRAAAERAMKVQTSVPTEGAWGWLDSQYLVWRPKDYWKPGTQVNVNYDLYGVNLGGGAYGAEDLTSGFTIGREQIVKGNTATHRVVVIRDGQQVDDFPASFGLQTDPGRVTRNGRYWAMAKHTSFSMTNERYNYRDVVVPWAVRMSNNGEFIHGYAPSIWAQGSQNVSHGCVNLSPANAKKYFDTALVGDPIEMEGAPIDLPTDGNDIWAIPWEKWTAKSALAG
ncbi:L,D-transpeptidase 5 [Longimycelium tulufanense]|uniref:L,D-transpeptidase 5 n=1 Tax=Longimycelium tulufanense TaxID=907463 RepID=A0A8J3CFY0_9PSEU|nr:Ig-like domain-containing protein [Longimycelium tulufanense]GGM61605.1 L,D-transpeptidase 5 [Longimycelium tulufanense]